MWGQLVSLLCDAEEAERTAADLRRRYGAQAEAWCETKLADLPQRDRRRIAILDIRRALRWTPGQGDGKAVGR